MSTTFTLSTQEFQGPLEALLQMIEARKMPVSKVSLSDVADAYLAYVEKLPHMPLGETAQFVLVASTLLLIKSRTLLPSLELTGEEEQSVAELERRLAQYALYRKSAKTLRKHWDAHPLLLARRSPARPAVFAPAEASGSRIREAALRIVRLLPKPEKVAEAAVAPVLALEDVISGLRKRLTGAFRARFSELTHTSNKQEVIVYFLAFLELVRSGSASVTQEKLFSDIVIESEHMAAPRYGA